MFECYVIVSRRLKSAWEATHTSCATLFAGV